MDANPTGLTGRRIPKERLGIWPTASVAGMEDGGRCSQKNLIQLLFFSFAEMLKQVGNNIKAEKSHGYPLVMTNIAIENGPFIVDLSTI